MRSTNAPAVTRRPPPISAIVIYSALLTGLLYSLGFHLSVDSPLRLNGHRPHVLELAENLQTKNANQIDQASQGHNVLLHFQMPLEMWGANASYFAGAYFRAAYEIYPRRVYIGADNQLINFAADIRNADVVPGIDWLHQHDVSRVFTFLPGDSAGPKAAVYRIP